MHLFTSTSSLQRPFFELANQEWAWVPDEPGSIESLAQTTPNGLSTDTDSLFGEQRNYFGQIISPLVITEKNDRISCLRIDRYFISLVKSFLYGFTSILLYFGCDWFSWFWIQVSSLRSNCWL